MAYVFYNVKFKCPNSNFDQDQSKVKAKCSLFYICKENSFQEHINFLFASEFLIKENKRQSAVEISDF